MPDDEKRNQDQERIQPFHPNLLDWPVAPALPSTMAYDGILPPRDGDRSMGLSDCFPPDRQESAAQRATWRLHSVPRMYSGSNRRL